MRSIGSTRPLIQTPRSDLQALNGKTQALARQSVVLRETNTLVKPEHLKHLAQVSRERNLYLGLGLELNGRGLISVFILNRRCQPYRWLRWA